MKNQWIAAALLITAAPLAQAGLFDVLSQASQVMKTVQTTRDAVAPAQPALAAAPTAAIDPQALQAYLGMDCATLKGAQASLAQQAAPSTAAKATGLLNSASGLLGFAGRMAGVPTDGLQQAAAATQQAQQLASAASGQPASAEALALQQASLQAALTAKSCS